MSNKKSSKSVRTAQIGSDLKKKSYVGDRFEKTSNALTTELNRAAPAANGSKRRKHERLSAELQQFVDYQKAQKKLSASINHSSQAIKIQADLLESRSLQSFSDSTTYTQQELEALRAKQKVIAEAIIALKHNPDAGKGTTKEEIGIVEKIFSWIEKKVFDEENAASSQLSLIENIHKIRQELALSSSIEKIDFNKVIRSLPKLSVFERFQNRLCNIFLGRKSKVAQSREKLIGRITVLHEDSERAQRKARDSLAELKSTFEKANQNIVQRIQRIETLQDQFKRKKASSLANLNAIDENIADLLALKPEKETKINENLNASKEHMDAIEKQLLSIGLIEERKNAIDMPVDAAQEITDAMMTEMFEATSSEKLSELVAESKELRKDIENSYRIARVSQGSISALQSKSSDNKDEILKLKKEIEEMKPSRTSAKVLASIENEVVELSVAVQRQLKKQKRNVAEANRRELELEAKRAEISELFVKCKKRHLTVLSELSEQKMAHCDRLISANEARLEGLPKELALEPIQANDSEFDSFLDIYAANLKKSGLSDEITEALDKSKKAHEKVVGLKKAYEKEMRKYQAAITDPDRSFWETAKETFAGLVQSKPEQEIKDSTEIERIDDAIGIEKKRLEGLEAFHRSILAHNGNVERLEIKKVAFQQAYVEAKSEIAALNSLVGQAEREELRQKSVGKSLQGVVASANAATEADKDSILETIAVTVKNIMNPDPEVIPIMSEEDLAKEIRLEANNSLKAVEGLIAECVALSDEISSCQSQGYDKFKRGNAESKIHQLKQKATALMLEIHSSSAKGKLELGVVQTLVSASRALQHAANAALLNTLLAIPTLEESEDVRAKMIQEAEMWAEQAEEWLSAQEEALGEYGYETVSLHRLVKVKNWLEVQRKNHELLAEHQMESQSSEDKALILSEKALYKESGYLLNTAREVLGQYETAKDTLCEYKENIAQAKAHKMEAAAVETKPAIGVEMPVESSVLVGNRNALFGETAPQPPVESKPNNIVHRALRRTAGVFGSIGAFITDAATWVGALFESGGAGFL